jgi:L-threonylcarbamoyladenylate synthase
MKDTLVLKVCPEKLDMTKICEAADIIRKGGLVAFPTETVYGLGANALNAQAILALFEAKKRPLDNPPIVHVKDPEDVYRLAAQVSNRSERLMRKFWPGPLTLVFKRSNVVPRVTVAGLDTIAVRMPKHEVSLALIRKSGCPIAAPSANLAGKPSPTTAKHVFDDLNGRIDAILDGGPTQIGVESTVLDVTVSPPRLLRPGGTTVEALRNAVGNVKLHPFVVTDKELQLGESRSPGMKHKHYAPKAELILVEGALESVVRNVRELSDSYRKKGVRVGILATEETKAKYGLGAVKSMGSRFDIATIAQNLFALLRDFDAENVEVIIAEGIPADDLGLAVMNRLRKASGYRIVKAE